MNVQYQINSGIQVNTLNIPPGEYDRKIKTQWMWRGLLQTVEHVV